MKINLGIYGDSFVKSNNLTAWANLLHRDYNYDVTNHGYPGTGLDYSYYKFLTTHMNHDKIIFFVSSIYRVTVFKNSKLTHESLDDSINDLTVEGIYTLNTEYPEMSEKLTGFQLSAESKKYIDNKLYEWLTFDYSNELLKYHSMISHIRCIRPDIHIVYSFDMFNKNAMYNISMIDISKFNVSSETTSRICHMNYIQNQQVADYMNQWLIGKNDFNITLDPKHVHEFYSEAATLEEAGLG